MMSYNAVGDTGYTTMIRYVDILYIKKTYRTKRGGKREM